MNKVTLRSWAGKVKEYHFYPLPGPNGMFPNFVKRVRPSADGTTTEMIMSDKERESEESKYFIPEDLDVVVTDGMSFDLDDPMQRNIWEACIVPSPLVVTSRDAKDSNGNFKIDGSSSYGTTAARYGIAELWIEIPGAASQQKVNRRKLISQAYQFIQNDTIGGQITKCKLLGKATTNVPESDIQDFLYERAENRPQDIIDLYTDGNAKMRLLILDAKSTGVIRYRDGLLWYAETLMGANDDAVLAFLKDPSNKTIFDAIKVATYPQYARPVEAVVPEEEKKPAKTTKTTKTT